MSAKPWRCRLRLHRWRIVRNEEDSTPYEQCSRCFAERDTQLGMLGSLQ